MPEFVFGLFMKPHVASESHVVICIAYVILGVSLETVGAFNSRLRIDDVVDARACQTSFLGRF